MVQLFFLCVRELAVVENTTLRENAFGYLDAERLKIAKKREKNPKNLACALGAGLLLQLGAQWKKTGRLEDNRTMETASKHIFHNVSELLSSLSSEVIPLTYHYGEEGQPLWDMEDMPYFSLSHTGDWVMLALSAHPVGADLQEPRRVRDALMYNRHFSEGEQALLLALKGKEQQIDLFYRLWTRKEAYGKCDGAGVRPFLSLDVSEVSTLPGTIWTEGRLDEYYYAVVEKGEV